MTERKRIIIGITGASGPVFGVRALQVLKSVPDVETHLIFSPAAAQTIAAETDLSLDDVRANADVVHSIKDIAASISSGSFKTEGILVAPCSIKTLSGIVNGFTDNLITRAADVCLKEGRKVVLMVRETPLHLGHLDLMSRATQYGAVIMPPVPAFYHRPQTIDDIVDQTVGRALDQFGIDAGIVRRWRDDTVTAAKAR
ncbi:MAG: UbiX family flavin prenyltransferase [Rhodospirillales bacterium]